MSSGELDTRERILKATWHLMETRRGQGVRIEDIAKRAGVSRQAVYLHFGTRSELLIATARYLDEVLGLGDRVRKIAEARTGVQALEAFFHFWANYIPEIYGMAKALLMVREMDEAAAAAWDDRMNAVYEGGLYGIQCLEREGKLATCWTVETAAEYLWATLSIQTWEILTIECGWSKEEYIERIDRAIKSTLVKSP